MSNLRLNKKQKRAIDIACDAMNAILNYGLDSDEDGSIAEAIEILIEMKN